ncbi:MAG: AAA family ATPase, partial [Candidatus Heimdallarchaeota archaeon]|nr:AAA family ATPase [Candidatus Heimdallarchaeota archaeon]
ELIITGQIGTGKTSLAKKFGGWVQQKSDEYHTNIKFVHVNCRRNRTAYMILMAIARELNSHVPTRGYSADELMEMVVELLEGKSATLLLVLDEIDFAVNNGAEDLLYALTRTSDERRYVNHGIALILIARSTAFLEKLDQSTRSSLLSATISLNPYSKEQLYTILESRIHISFVDGSVSSESIDLAAEIASSRGDARQALELVWYAGKFADKEASSIVYPEHVRLAKSNVDPSLLRNVVETLSLHKLLLLLGIARQLRLTRSANITTGDAKQAYSILCEEFGVSSRKHTQLWEYLKEFEKSDIIVLKLSGQGQRGTTQLISLHDASTKELEVAVLKRIKISDK